jgi:hypothetical protein
MQPLVRGLAAVSISFALGCTLSERGLGGPVPGQETDGSAGRGGAGGGGGGTGGGGAGGQRLDGGDRSEAAADRPADAPADLAPPVDVLPPDAALLANGVACGGAAVCASGFCVDGVCCENACSAACFACAGSTRGGPAGLCLAEAMGTSCAGPSCNGSMLSGPASCNGAGLCLTPTAQPCPGGFSCENATTCRTRCNGVNDCAPALVCDVASGQCRPRKANGQACDGRGADCVSGFCVDGVCCDQGCGGLCRACVQALTLQPDGHCAPLPSGADSKGDCPMQDPVSCGRDGTCDGNGACRRYPDGTVCGGTCCRQGPGGVKPCTFACHDGLCDRQNPTPGNNCMLGDCCCPGSGPSNIPTCTLPIACQNAMCF